MTIQTQTMRQPAQEAGQSQQSHCQEALLSMDQVAQLSGVSKTDLLGLMECGALTPAVPDADPHFFDISCVMKLQRAASVRQDLALDSHGFAMALMLFNQITKTEAALHSTQGGGQHGNGLGDAYIM